MSDSSNNENEKKRHWTLDKNSESPKPSFYEIKYVNGKTEHPEPMFMKTWQFPQYIRKGWGHEMWIVNKEEYCGKLLFFNKGKKCSWHYHKLKDEVFFLHSGKMIVRLSDEDDIEKSEEKIINPGDALHIYKGLRHQMEALEDSELYEFSTQHFDSDSYRIIKGD